ncbi:hypothetical protein [Nocardioides baculatus]|uniref:Uncharacterized protein n=1 Tax=Nocardioides baculatus TaxID=2801337 RepID=A0ABS1LDP4_9ACTN|nr:hypothetical protein [Nocardioides baculatus]MBL0749672.1 hypothetical protein [Nocardioides baculatus]
MTADPASGAPGAPQFLVRPDGSVAGDDGASGALAAALPYTGRLARRMGELAGVGDLRLVEAFGTDHLTVGVTWTPAGEGTYRAALAPLAPRTVPTFTVVGAVDPAAAVIHCLGRLDAVEGVSWSAVVTVDARVIGIQAEQQDLDRLAEVGNRMLAILRSLEDQHGSGFVRLGFEEGALLGASLGRHALVAAIDGADDEALTAMIDEVRAILADQDLSAVASHREPEVAPVVEAPPEVPPVAPAPLVGARFGGAAPRKERGSRRFGR